MIVDIKCKADAILSRFEAELEGLRERNQYRTLDTIPGINFCSNDYLALSDEPRLRLAVQAALQSDKAALSSTGSRLLTGNTSGWEHLEARLAAFVGAQSAIYFSSGYLANIGLLSAVIASDATVFSDSANHASLIDGVRLTKAAKVVFPHSDLDFLESALQRSQRGERIIVVESIFSMDGDRAPLADLYRLAERYDASLIVDEAHATGVAGPQGRGLVAAEGRPDCVLATVHTCGKALASAGGFVAGSGALRRYLINKSRPFIFTTALPPYVAAQTDTALTLVEAADDRRNRLQELSGELAAGLSQLGFAVDRSRSHIIPLVLGSNAAALRAAAHLQACGFGVKAIRPPTVPEGTARLRLSLTSRLSGDDLAGLVRALSDVV